MNKFKTCQQKLLNILTGLGGTFFLDPEFPWPDDSRDWKLISQVQVGGSNW